MPGSLAIGAFVLGAVLLLVAVVGGQFKVFAAEVSGSVGPVARGFAGVLGLVFVLVGLSKEFGGAGGGGNDGGGNDGGGGRPVDSTAAPRPRPRPVDPDPKLDESGFTPRALDVTEADEPAAEPAVTLADAREEVLAAVRAAVDAATEAVNEQDGSGLDAHYEGTALQELSTLPAFIPGMLATQGADYASMRAMGYAFRSAFEISDVDDVEVDANGERAEVAFRFLFRVRIEGNGACSQTRLGPGPQTYGLRRREAGWRVYRTSVVGTLPPIMEGC